MWKRLKALVTGEQLDRELNAEVTFHLDMEAEKYVKQGLDPQAARTRALKNFGPMTRHVEETRDARGVSWLDDCVQDVRYAARTLWKTPGYAAIAVLTLGLGIGANAAIFSVVNGVLFTPLPYANGQRLMIVGHAAPLANQQNFGVSIKELYDYREQLASLDGLVEFHQMNFDLLRRGEPDRVATGVVSHNFFDVLGIRPLVGRTFADADDDEGAEAVLVLGYDYWTTRFGSDPNIVGQVFQMNDRPHTVIGVMPDVPHYPNSVDVYMPTSACPFRSAAERNIVANRRAFSGLQVFGLLKPGVSFEAASTEVATVAQRFQQDFPNIYRGRVRVPLPHLAGAGGADRQRAADPVAAARHHRPGAAAGLRQRRQPHAGADAAPRPRVRHARRPGGRARPAGAPAAGREHAAVAGGRRRRPRLRLDDAGRAHAVREPLHAAHRCHRPRPLGAGVHAGGRDRQRPGLRIVPGALHPLRRAAVAEAGQSRIGRVDGPPAAAGRARRGAGGAVGRAPRRGQPAAGQRLATAAGGCRLPGRSRAGGHRLRQLLEVSGRRSRSCGSTSRWSNG